MKGAEWGQSQKQKDVYVFHVLLRLHEPFFYVDLPRGSGQVLPARYYLPRRSEIS